MQKCNVYTHAGGSSENERREDPPNRLSDDIPIIDDDMVEYDAGMVAGSQTEL